MANTSHSTIKAMLDRIDGKKTAQAGGKGVYFPEGVYRGRVRDIKMVTRRVGGEVLYIVRFDILESSDVARLPVGSVADWAANFRHDSTPDNIARFLAACAGVDLTEITPDMAKASLSGWVDDKTDLDPTKPSVLFGYEVAIQVTRIKTRKGGDFSEHIFTHIPPTE